MIDRTPRKTPRRMRMGSSPAMRGDWDAGTVVNIIVIAIFVGLFGYGIWWVIKSLGGATKQYSDAMINTHIKAETVACQGSLRVIATNLALYEAEHGVWPESLKELAEWSMNQEILRCPANDRQPYIYIPGQGPDSRDENVLVYEKEPTHNDKCSVLFVNGTYTLLTPEELQAALTLTLRNLKDN